MAIPSINGGELLARMLPSVKFPMSSVVVLDQGSTDRTEAICAEAGASLVQLGQPHTYTAACNIGARIARERGAKYLCVANNDLVFRTDVIAELHAELERDPLLAVVAPSQVTVQDRQDRQLSYRVFWRLETVDFLHDIEPPNGDPARLEADFCEMTCALVRMSVIDEIGFLDDDYGFYHEDADFGFRVRQAGFNCAYLPRSQIEHYLSSTFGRGRSAEKARYMTANKMRFAKKHLGFGLRHHRVASDVDEARFGRTLHPYLTRYGLLTRAGPELIIGRPDTHGEGYLFADFEADRLPDRLMNAIPRYTAVFAPSAGMQALFARLGTNSFYVPPGIEPDLFHPWGPALRHYDELTYLACVDGQRSELLRPLLQAWQSYLATGGAGRLVLMGHGLQACLGRAPDTGYCGSRLEFASYQAERIETHEPLAPMPRDELAELYRGVDYTIIDSDRPAGMTALRETMACGVPPILRTEDGSRAWTQDGLLQRLRESASLDQVERAARGRSAMYQVRGSATLRHTVMGLYRALETLQQRDPAQTLRTLKRREASLVRKILREPVAAQTLGERLSEHAATRLVVAGRLTTMFGTVWQDRGLRDACGEAAWALRAIVVRLADQAARRARAAGRAKIRAVAWLARGAEVKADSVLLIGYIDAQLGLGQSLRGLALAMSHSKVAFAIRPFGVGVERRRSQPYMPERYDESGAHAVNIIEVTPDELPRVFSHLGRHQFRRSYNILRTYWELARAPEAWRPALRRIDEIWVPNTFVADSLRSVFDGPISVVPPCLDLARLDLARAELAHAHFGLAMDRFHFIFSFDYHSFPERKNPLAVLRAFRAAFPDDTTPVGLVIKSAGNSRDATRWRSKVRAFAQHDRRITLIDEPLSRDEMLSLLATCGAYVSLHRAEGFGLGMAEAMALGKPVIGTDYSGCTDFLSETTGFPVPYELRPIRPGEYVHADGQVWAEPVEAAAAAAMQRVFENRDEAAARGLAGQRLVIERYGLANVASIVETRLNAILEARRRSGYSPSILRMRRRKTAGTLAR